VIALRPIADCISRALRRHRSALVREDDLQDTIAAALTEAGLAFTKEHRLGPRERLDFLLSATGVAIEVKKANAGLDVWRQVARYLEHDAVTGCIVIAPRIEALPGNQLVGKPVWPLPLWKFLL
jgi:hypothetical protein